MRFDCVTIFKSFSVRYKQPIPVADPFVDLVVDILSDCFSLFDILSIINAFSINVPLNYAVNDYFIVCHSVVIGITVTQYVRNALRVAV